MEERVLGRIGRSVPVLAYGGAALSDVDQETADRSLAEAFTGGVRYFDVAASYGDAELRFAPFLREHRQDVWLATKTGDRDADGAWASISRSLERLGVDRVDLIQLHAVGDLGELDLITARGGALEALVRARDEGLVGHLGITGHGHGAPATHLEALRRFPFDTVLTPWNRALSQRPQFAADFAALTAEIQRQRAALLTIKTVARRNWPEGSDQRYATWYEPFDEQREITAAVSWSLSFPQITALAMAGDVRLVGMFLQAEAERVPREEAERVLDGEPEYASPFVAMPA